MAIPYSRMVFGRLPWYGLLVVSGMALAVWIAGREEMRMGLPKDTAVDAALLVLPMGIVGARLYYVVMSWDVFAADPVSVLFLWEGGLAIYGGVIGGALGVWLCARKKKIPFAQLIDTLILGVPLAQAIGRWGNYFNMEAYGPQIIDPALQFFPFGVLVPAEGGMQWHMATFFYESVWNFAVFVVLWNIRKKQKQHGDMFCWYLFLYGCGRFVIEQLRQDSLYIGPFRVSQWLSLLLCAVSVMMLLKHNASSRRHWAGMAVCMALWLLRWAVLNQPFGYALCMLAACAASIWLLRRSKRLTGAIALMLLDAAGLLLSLTAFPAGQLAHALLCSVVLAGQMLSLCKQ